MKTKHYVYIENLDKEDVQKYLFYFNIEKILSLNFHTPRKPDSFLDYLMQFIYNPILQFVLFYQVEFRFMLKSVNNFNSFSNLLSFPFILFIILFIVYVISLFKNKYFVLISPIFHLTVFLYCLGFGLLGKFGLLVTVAFFSFFFVVFLLEFLRFKKIINRYNLIKSYMDFDFKPNVAEYIKHLRTSFDSMGSFFILNLEFWDSDHPIICFILEKYPKYINMVKFLIEDDTYGFKKLVEKFPKTKLYLR